MGISEFSDPFKKIRQEEGILKTEDHGEEVNLVLRLKDVRKCAHQWESFKSGKAKPGRIVIPSEEEIRSIRQIPVETDPPQHSAFRDLLDTWFKRPLNNDYQEKLNKIINGLLDEVIEEKNVEVVHDFSLKLQSRALALLLNTSMDESETWISWGTHVFRAEGNELDQSKASTLDSYILNKIEEATQNPGDDLYSILLESKVNNRTLTTEEIHGIINLTFAGGRDTVINALTNSIAYFAEHPDRLKWLKEYPDSINKAVEELLRYFSPLTHLGRVSSSDTEICSHAIKEDAKIGLNWASANRDEAVFENPDQIELDRKVNPHVAFGFGIHNCLGATHARQILRQTIKLLSERVASISIHTFEENFEEIGSLKRKTGFESLRVSFNIN
ncbi:MAG: cytochrome P450 [Balneola sp.]|nr:MAG: cytochrome P450 [Balneola sp.]